MEGILTFVNDKLCQLTGYSREDVMGSPFADFLHKDDLPHLMEAFLTAISGTKISEMLEFRLIRKDGQCIWVHSNPEPIVIGGQVNGFSAIIYDISDRKRAELALRESEAQYRLLSEHTADIVALMDMDFKVTYQSPSGEKQRGYTSQEIIELPLEKHLTPDSLKLAMEVYFRDLAKVEADPDYNPIIVLELEYYRKDGTTFWAESKFSIIRDGSGKPVSILAEVRDITERKKAADEMSKREARFRNISAITSDIAYSCSTREDGRFSIDWMTGAAERITGYSCEEIQAQGCWRFLVIEGDQNLFDENVTGLASGSHGMCELRISHKNGGIVWIASSAECVQEPGTPGRQLLYGGLRDITDRKRAGEALQKSEAQYRLLAEHTTDFIWLMDMNLNNIYVSPSVMKRTGFTDQEMMELPLERHITPDSLKVAAEMVLEFIPRVEADSTYNPTSTFDMEYICKDGTTFWSENKFSVIRDSNGIPISILGEARDTTDRRLIEEKLLKSFESLKKTLNDAINTMVKIVETRDPYTSGHQQKVADLSTAIAREMKLEDTRIDQIRMAALIHDIGKMYVPSDILIRPGKLTDMELALIKTHAQSGYDIVKGMDFPCSVAEAVLQHHERLDGSGYPNGLKGEDTLLEAKILAVADVIEAMASHRPYRPALGIDKALEEISMYKGKLYDPDVVDTCLELFKSGKFEFKPV
jgi:PAS domain S-box-containing protein/putative nucleotidyltransferase with HDIG domain